MICPKCILQFAKNQFQKKVLKRIVKVKLLIPVDTLQPFLNFTDDVINVSECSQPPVSQYPLHNEGRIKCSKHVPAASIILNEPRNKRYENESYLLCSMMKLKLEVTLAQGSTVMFLSRGVVCMWPWGPATNSLCILFQK